LLGEAEALRGGGGFAARADLQLAEDRGDVMVDRPRGYEQALGYLGVAQTFGHELQHLQLPRGELSGGDSPHGIRSALGVVPGDRTGLLDPSIRDEMDF